MNWRTHVILGANTAWVAVLIGQVDQNSIFLVIAGALAGLLPDIDAVSAKIHYLGGGVLGGLRGVFLHRGFFHSIIATCLVFIVSLIFFSKYYLLLPVVITLGYFSHPFIDGFNYQGVQYFFPYRKKIRLLPRRLTIKTNGLIDQSIFFVGVLVLILFILTVYYPQLNNLA